jgi:hypothetical protein
MGLRIYGSLSESKALVIDVKRISMSVEKLTGESKSLPFSSLESIAKKLLTTDDC